MGPETHEIVELEAMAVLGVCGMVTCGRSRWAPMCVSRVPFGDWWCKKGHGWVYATRFPRSGHDHHQPTAMRDFVIHGVAGRVTFYAPIQARFKDEENGDD